MKYHFKTHFGVHRVESDEDCGHFLANVNLSSQGTQAIFQKKIKSVCTYRNSKKVKVLRRQCCLPFTALETAEAVETVEAVEDVEKSIAHLL